ncbi:MAG: hypothetical protein INR66_26770 [Gordonia polyisoprenivorans]|nr:hypothetical protein [Gordonia polyisoprenivorans]
MLTTLTNHIVNLFAAGNLDAGADAAVAGAPLAIFRAGRGRVVVQHNNKIIDKIDVDAQGRGHKAAALAELNAHGYEPLGPALRVGNPPHYSMPVRRTHR